MVPVDVFMLLLLGAAMVFSLVETGMLAYSIYMGDRVDEYNFLLLCSVWTLLVAPAIIISLITRRVGSSIGGPNKLPLFGPLILGLKAVTMVLWAGGAAALLRISIILNREIPMYYFEGFFAAKLAFPIITWVVFVALLALNILVAFRLLESEKLGWHPTSKQQFIADQHQPRIAEVQ